MVKHVVGGPLLFMLSGFLLVISLFVWSIFDGARKALDDLSRFYGNTVDTSR